MRKLLTIALTLLLACFVLPAHAASYCGHCGYLLPASDYVYCPKCGNAIDNAPNGLMYSSDGYLMGFTIDRLSTRSGPGTLYSDTGSFNNMKNVWVEVSHRAWDSRNEIWWVRVHIGEDWLWTGYKRFDSTTLPIDLIPIWGSDPFTTPVHVTPVPPQPFAKLIGQSVMVCTQGQARLGPGTQYGSAAVIEVGDWYVILDVQRGNTRKDWYMIRLSTGQEVWAASGLFELNGLQGGTVWGVPD